MRNLKELRAILTAIYCINFTSDNRDKDIEDIVKYAFNRIFNSNTNLITLACIGKNKNTIMPEVLQLLKEDTKFERKEEEL